MLYGIFTYQENSQYLFKIKTLFSHYSLFYLIGMMIDIEVFIEVKHFKT